MPRDFKEHFIWTYPDLVKWLDKKTEEGLFIFKVIHLWILPYELHVFEIILQEIK